MIAASDPVEYIPAGRHTISRHPGSVIDNQSNNSTTSDTIFLQKLRQVNITEENPKEFWIVRENGVHEEEELYCSGKVVVHSKGTKSTRILHKSYTCDTDVKHALWCNFSMNIYDQFSKTKEIEEEENIGTAIDCICLLDSYILKVFTETGEDYVSSLQFQVSAIWPTKYGIILEKAQIPFFETRCFSAETSRLQTHIEANSPVVFSLMHPLEEICPILLKHGSVSYMCDSSQQIVFTSSEPSLALIYDKKTGLHSVYKIRRASAEECQIVCGNNDTTSSLLNPSTSASPLHMGNSISCNRSTNKGHLSIFGIPNPPLSSMTLGQSSSPFGSRCTSYNTTSGGPSPSQQQQQQHSRSHSPMATISRCQSPTHSPFSSLLGTPGNSIVHSRLHQAVRTTILNHSFNSPASCTSMEYQDNTVFSRPLYPKICLEYVWTENSGNVKDAATGRASKVLLTTDLVGQNYLCYLVPGRSQLFLARLERTNKLQQILFGMVTSIIAKDVVNIPKLNMLAIIDLSNGVALYSGITYVGKVHISGILPNLTGCNYFLPNMSNKLSSPFPRRSSLISQNCTKTPEIKFKEALHLLSPVGAPCPQPPVFLENTLLDANIRGLKEAVGSKITLEYYNKNYFRITLPTCSTSPLVTKCLQILRSVLQKDLAMQLLVKWYGARNAPGPQEFAPEEEWRLFLVILFTLLGYDVDKMHLIYNSETDLHTERNSPIVLPKKQKTNDSGSNDDWTNMLNSVKDTNTKYFVSCCLGLQKMPNTYSLTENTAELSSSGKINTQAILYPFFPLVMFSLHLLHEELKLNCLMSENLPLLAQLLYQLSIDLKFDEYARYYFLDYPFVRHIKKSISQITESDLQKITVPSYIPSEPPKIFDTLNKILNDIEVTPYPYLNQVNLRSKNLIYLFALITNENKAVTVEMRNFIKFIIPVGSRVDMYDNGCKTEREAIKQIKHPTTDKIVLLYHEIGFNKEDLESLPPGIALILKDVMYKCREEPPSYWPANAYELVDRQDLSALQNHASAAEIFNIPENEGKSYSTKELEQDDGMEFDDKVFKLRFSKDHRIAEVKKLLNSSKPVRIAITQRPDVSDHEFIEEQEKHLHALCTRTMALPVARGMFTLRTSNPIITEQLPIPRLCLTGKAPPRGTTVELAHIDVPQNMNLWPLFHNGVAAGLRIHPNASNIDSTWIVYNKQQQGELGIEHSGFLMALGLNGHLKNLAPFNMYEYLVECHETTSVGLLLGLSATHRGTMNVSMTKLLSLHVETLLPPTSIELNVQQNVQIAALMGVGLVYQGTAHRHISHALLSEIGRPPGPEMKNCVDRESYSLAAGLALGLVVLGQGGGSDLSSIPDTLHYYMVGGHARPFTGAQKDKYKSPSYQIREGDSINIDVTCPGATIALGLMYFNSGNKAVAEWMKAPDTQYLLDFVRPDFLLLRILARSLILWDEIEPTKAWVSSHVPDIVYKYRLQRPTPEIAHNVDLETMNQAYCNIIAGACMALGLKYAGTSNTNAYKTLHNYAQMFTALSHKSIAELAGKSTIETCFNVILLSISIVMAGTGDLQTMRLGRHARSRVGPTNSVVTYGSHLATHMALGFLFLGGGRYNLSNSQSAIAALIISLFPKFPTHSNDNRYHLQALRHLYVLAVEPRLILPKDIDSGQYCYVSVHLTFENESDVEGQEVTLQAPCLLPHLNKLKKIEIKDNRYWEIVFDKNYNWQLLENMLKRCNVLGVKQKAGCLSYIDDPHGFKSLLAQTLTTENVIPWTVQPEQITSFTNDKTVLNIVKYFLQLPKNNKIRENDKTFSSELKDKMEITNSLTEDSQTVYHNENIALYNNILNIEKQFLQTFAIIVYECVIKDKISLLPLWTNMIKSIQIIEKQPNSFSIWQIKLISSLMLKKNNVEENDRLLSEEAVLALKQKIALILDYWENDLESIFNNNLSLDDDQLDDLTIAKLCAYFTFYNISYKINNVTNYGQLQTSGTTDSIPRIALFKIQRLLQNQ